MQRFNLPGKQIKPLLQSRMPCRIFRVVIEMSVMTLGKNGDAVDVRRLHRAGKFLRVKISTDVADKRRRVKIQVDLPRAKFRVFGFHQDGIIGERCVFQVIRAGKQPKTESPGIAIAGLLIHHWKLSQESPHYHFPAARS